MTGHAAPFVSTDALIQVNGVDLSEWAVEVLWEERYEVRDSTGVGEPARTRKARLLTGLVQVQWLQDYGAGGPYRTLYPLLGQTVPVKVRPRRGLARSMSNREHQADAVISEFPPMTSAQGQLSTFSTTWDFTGEVTVAPQPTPIHSTVLTVGRSGNFYGYLAAPTVGQLGDRTFQVGAQTVAITYLGYNSNTRALRIDVTTNAQALALLGYYVEVGALVLPMTGHPGTGTDYSTTAPNPNWADGQTVAVTVWQDDPR